MAKADLPDLEQKIRHYILENNSQELKGCLSLAFSWGEKLPLDLLSPLEDFLFHKDSELVRYVIQNVLQYKKNAKQAVPLFLRIAKKETDYEYSDATRFAAVNAIWEISQDADLVIPFLNDYIKAFPEEGCDLVTKVGNASKEVVDRLIKVIENQDCDEIWAAVDALGALGPTAAIAKPSLLKLTKHQSGLISQRAITALKKISQ